MTTKDWKAEYDKLLGKTKEVERERDDYKRYYFHMVDREKGVQDAFKQLILKVLDQ
jgi:hypothetical protein